jgi:hypothetical protein
VHHRTVRQIHRLVQDDPTVLDVGLERVHQTRRICPAVSVHAARPREHDPRLHDDLRSDMHIVSGPESVGHRGRSDPVPRVRSGEQIEGRRSYRAGSYSS